MAALSAASAAPADGPSEVPITLTWMDMNWTHAATTCGFGEERFDCAGFSEGILDMNDGSLFSVFLLFESASNCMIAKWVTISAISSPPEFLFLPLGSLRVAAKGGRGKS